MKLVEHIKIDAGSTSHFLTPICGLEMEYSNVSGILTRLDKERSGLSLSPGMMYKSMNIKIYTKVQVKLKEII